MLHRLKGALKYSLVPLLYRYPPSSLEPQRLAVFLHGLLEIDGVEGDVGEIGCNHGGTAVLAATLLKRIDSRKRYICYDTFGGFVDAQFEIDARSGTARAMRHDFSGNSIGLVRKILDFHRCQSVELVAGDITVLPEDQLLPRYAALPIDVDLSEPTYRSLQRFWPRMAPGGIIYVDDCPDHSDWRAREGYRRFCQEENLPETYRCGLGLLRKPLAH